MTYREFVQIIRRDISAGVIKIEQPSGENYELSDLDLAIQYALAQEWDQRGGPFTFTPEDVYYFVGKWCGVAERERLLPSDEEVNNDNNDLR